MWIIALLTIECYVGTLSFNTYMYIKTKCLNILKIKGGEREDLIHLESILAFARPILYMYACGGILIHNRIRRIIDFK